MLIGWSSLLTYDLFCGEMPIREISPDPTKTDDIQIEMSR